MNLGEWTMMALCQRNGILFPLIKFRCYPGLFRCIWTVEIHQYREPHEQTICGRFHGFRRCFMRRHDFFLSLLMTQNRWLDDRIICKARAAQCFFGHCHSTQNTCNHNVNSLRSDWFILQNLVRFVLDQAQKAKGVSFCFTPPLTNALSKWYNGTRQIRWTW